MQPSRRILIGIVVVLIVGAGLVTGVYVSSEKSGTHTASAPKKIKANFNTYEISPTSRGETLITVDSALKVEAETFIAILAKEDAAEVKTGQKVLLYDAQGNALGDFGKVSAVTLDADKVNVGIVPDGDGEVISPQIAYGKIITNKIPDAQRLPLSALIDNDGAPYVWETIDNKDGTSTVYFKPANILHITKDYIVLAENPVSTNIFVLNPDDALQDGQKINVKEVLYSAPEMTEEQRIATLIETRHAPEEVGIDPMLFGQSMPGSSGAISSADGCDQTPQISSDFIKKIRELSQEPSTAP